MRLILHFIVNVAAVALAAYLLKPNVAINGIEALLLVTLVLGVVNTIIRPIIHLVAFPINLLTFGLFSVTINGILVWYVARLVPGFEVANIWWAIAFSVVLSIVSAILHLFAPHRS